MIEKFIKAEGPPRLLFYYQLPYRINEYGEIQELQGARPDFIVTDGKNFYMRMLHLALFYF